MVNFSELAKKSSEALQMTLFFVFVDNFEHINFNLGPRSLPVSYVYFPVILNVGNLFFLCHPTQF